MEANKDAALHYFELAEKAVHANDNERAIRYLNKSLDLFPTHKAKDLLERMQNATTNSTPKDKSHESTSSSSSSHHDHTATNGDSSHVHHRNTSTSNNDYTPEEAEAVRKIKACKDLYEILGVNKTATESDLKKAYRRLALQFHPDKCKAPGATEAFKAIGKAFSVLSDTKKREQYDQYGHAMEPQYNHRHTGGRQYYYYADEDEDFSAEEIFNLFFGYSGPTARTYRRRQQANAYHFSNHATQNSTHTLIQLLPYLFLFLISILGTLLVSEPQFQLHRTGKYTNMRTTRDSNIQYFVKPDFRPPKTDSDLDKLEASVIDEYISDLRHQCYREQQYKESMLWRARMMNDNNLYRQAERQTTPSCTKLNDFLRSYA